MFFCDICAEKNSYPQSFSKSYGPCEICHKTAECSDVSSRHLVGPVTKSSEPCEPTPGGGPEGSHHFPPGAREGVDTEDRSE